MLTSSALRMLDQREIEPSAIPARANDTPPEAFMLGPSSAALPVNSDPPDDHNRAFKLVRPLVPDNVLPSSLTVPRGYEDFMKALEEEKKAGRLKILDLFE